MYQYKKELSPSDVIHYRVFDPETNITICFCYREEFAKEIKNLLNLNRC